MAAMGALAYTVIGSNSVNVHASLPADNQLAGISVSANPDEMANILRAELRPLHGMSLSIEHCNIARIRYRPGLRMHVLYELSLTDKITGHPRKIWASGSLYAANRSLELFKKLRMRFKAPARGDWRTFEPVHHLPQLGMFIQIFPFDRRLPKLATLLFDGRFNLGESLSDELGSDEYRNQAFVIEPVRYRAGLGAALIATPVNENARNCVELSKKIYLKMYRDRRGAETYPIHKRLSDRTKDESFTVAEPLAYVNSLETLCEKPVAGSSLHEHLINHENVDELCRRSARALVDFQNTKVPINRAHKLELEIKRASEIAHILCVVCPQLHAGVTDLITTIQRKIRPSEPKLTHLDLKAEHIIFTAEKVFFIDLDACGFSDPLLDPSLFVARLHAMRFQYPEISDHVFSASDAFLDTYLSLTPTAYRAQLTYFYALACLKVALSLFQHQQPNWPEYVTATIDRASSLTASLH